MTPKAIEMAKQAANMIDAHRSKIREARSVMAEAEAGINLEMARLHTFIVMVEQENE